MEVRPRIKVDQERPVSTFLQDAMFLEIARRSVARLSTLEGDYSAWNSKTGEREDIRANVAVSLVEEGLIRALRGNPFDARFTLSPTGHARQHEISARFEKAKSERTRQVIGSVV